jgi:hypothetical protein
VSESLSQGPSGARLRQKTVQPAILNNTPGYKALKKQIHGLERKQDHQEIFRLLFTLSEWQKSVNRPFPFLGEDEDDDDEEKPVEIIGLTADDQEVIDVDTYILEVLLVKVIKAEPMDDEHTSNTTAADAPTAVVKQEEGENLPKEVHKDKSSQQEVFDMSSSPGKEPAKKKQRTQTKKKPSSKDKNKDKSSQQEVLAMSSSIRKVLRRAASMSSMEKYRKDSKLVLFEFKFCSYDDECAGVLNVPLLRGAKSGWLHIPPGTASSKDLLRGKQTNMRRTEVIPRQPKKTSPLGSRKLAKLAKRRTVSIWVIHTRMGH